MSQIDETIRRALSLEDLLAYDALGRKQSIVAEALAAFQSQHRLIAVAGWAAGFLLFGFAVISAWRFLLAPDIREMLIWGGAAALASTGLGLVKLWFWMEMQKNSIVREIKRLEFQVASLIAQSRP